MLGKELLVPLLPRLIERDIAGVLLHKPDDVQVQELFAHGADLFTAPAPQPITPISQARRAAISHVADGPRAVIAIGVFHEDAQVLPLCCCQAMGGMQRTEDRPVDLNEIFARLDVPGSNSFAGNQLGADAVPAFQLVGWWWVGRFRPSRSCCEHSNLPCPFSSGFLTGWSFVLYNGERQRTTLQEDLVPLLSSRRQCFFLARDGALTGVFCCSVVLLYQLPVIAGYLLALAYQICFSLSTGGALLTNINSWRTLSLKGKRRFSMQPAPANDPPQETLRSLRQAHGMGLSALARAIPANKAAVHRWEMGVVQKLDVWYAIRMGEIFGVDIARVYRAFQASQQQAQSSASSENPPTRRRGRVNVA